MIRVGKKFFKPHFCPDCGKPIIFVRHPLSERCPRCQKRYRRKRPGHKKQQQKYSTTYRRIRAGVIAKQPYCALCGDTDHLTCHHAVEVKTGEWSDRHMTVLCSQCHELWETKVNIIRSMNKKGEI